MIKLKEYHDGSDIAVFYRGKEVYRGQFTRALTITVKDYLIRDRGFRKDVVDYCNSFGDPIVYENDSAFDIADTFNQLLFMEMGESDDTCVGNESGTIEVCTVDQIAEAAHRTLEPKYDARKSFYGKAHVVDDSDGSQILYSYDTPVCKINDRGEVELLSMWDSSQTTLRHVKEFLQQNGFKVGSKSQIAAMYGKKVERFSRKRGKIVREAKHARIIERQLNEGPGAGYTIKVNGLSDINITSASFVDYVEEVGWTFDVSGTCNIDKMSADSYYYGTGDMMNVPANITKIFVNWYWVDEDEETVRNFSDSELVDWINSFANDRLDDIEIETVFGGGWMHSTYDGTIDAVDKEDGDVSLVITDKEAIDYIDTAVQGENYAESYIVTDETDTVLEAFDTEEEAIAFAQEELKTGSYEALTVERYNNYWGYGGEYIDTFEDGEVVWQGEYEYDDDYEVDEYED